MPAARCGSSALSGRCSFSAMLFTASRTPGGKLMSIHRPGLLLLAACAALGGLAGVAVAQHYPPGVYQEFAWRMIGPLRGGRTRAVAGVTSPPSVFYVGPLDGGVTWQRVLYKDQDTGGSAVAIDPSRPDIVYAALWQSRLGPWEDKNEFQGTGGGLFKSTDGGTTWKPLTAGLPSNLVQVNIAIAPSAPQRLYAAAGTSEPGDYSSAAGLGVFRSDDAGESWVRISSDPRPALRIGGGDLPVLRVDPTNPDVVYSASLVTMKSSDGGRSWVSLRGAPGGDDYQNLWISPSDPRVIALAGDQGAIVTLNGGESWSSWFNQPTAQLFHVSVTPTFPYQVCAAQQESGSVCIASRGNDGEITDRDWHPVGAIEYGYVA